MNIEYYTVEEYDSENNVTEYNYEKFYEAAKQYSKLVELDNRSVHLIHNVITDNNSMGFTIASYYTNTKIEILSI